MRPIVILCLAALAAVASAPGAHARPDAGARRQPARRVAVTFDDLPLVSRNFRESADQDRVTAKLLAALRAHAVPAIGFVNERTLRRDGALDPARVALLRRWADAGQELGNHGWSHLDLHRVPVDSFLADVARGDSVTAALLAARGERPRWFRHPFLHTGRSLEVRDRVDRALAERGYRVAPVTIDNYDYQFAAAYDDALARRDTAEAAGIRREYLAYMERVVAYYEGQSMAILGRELPQVLLLHANLLNADAFDGLARLFRARGYAFVPLREAVADAAYRSADEYVGPAGITWLHRWAITRRMPGSTFAGEPEVPAAIVEAAERAARR